MTSRATAARESAPPNSATSGQNVDGRKRTTCGEIRTVCCDVEHQKQPPIDRYREGGFTHKRRRRLRHLSDQASFDSVESFTSGMSIPEHSVPSNHQVLPHPTHTQNRGNIRRLRAQQSLPAMGNDFVNKSLQRSAQFNRACRRRHSSEPVPLDTLQRPRRGKLERSKVVNRDCMDLPEADQELCGGEGKGKGTESMFLYRTNDLHTWRHSPSRSDMKGQTRIRRSCRPFAHVSSPAHRKSRALSLSNHCDATTRTLLSTPPSSTSTSNEGNTKSRKLGLKQIRDLNYISRSVIVCKCGSQKVCRLTQ